MAMLGNFEHETVAVVRRLQRVENFRQMRFELHVDDGADHLGNMAFGMGLGGISHDLRPSLLRVGPQMPGMN
jgi:predicted transcriptional regulator